ncbi:MAG: hypothetical protein QW046_01925 [Candidatus Micrarchaeaceae archaeon]
MKETTKIGNYEIKLIRNKEIEDQLELKYQRILAEKREKIPETIYIEEDNTPQIPDDLFDDIVDYDDLKKLLLNALRKNERMAVLFVGPPATAKTMFLYSLQKLPNSMIITAYNTTKAGLRDIFLNYNPKYLGIDEIEKADTYTTYTLMSVIENGIITKSIAGEHIEKRVDPIIFATANSTKKLSEALLSRFMVFHFKPYTREQLFQIGMHMLEKRDITIELKEQIINTILDMNILRDPRDFLNIIKFTETKSFEDFKNDLNNMIKYIKK